MRFDKPILRQDPEAWQEGYNAGLKVDDQRCPYKAGSAKSWAWRSGYIEGRVERARQTGS
jgi:hypothetical protein